MRHLAETKPFLLTTEFVGTLVALGALAVTTASSDSLDAGQLWLLATALVAAFVFSRGFAKASAPSQSWDPRETLGRREGSGARHDKDEEEETHQMSTTSREDYGMRGGAMSGYGRGMGMRQTFPIETKPFFLTSEFWGSVALIVGLAIGAGTSEDIDTRLFWILATAITAAYVVSRGIAKSGTKSRSWDPRDDLMQGARERMESRGQDS